ncbi:MAG: protein-disulfide reductase DsbD family protein [Pseudopelagicola sp.]|nr:protein-disulfide reductase DsbD family protein [Pseudopelagicola sp.]
MSLRKSVQSISTALLIALTATLTAQAGGRGDDIAKADILTGWRTASGTHMAALRIELKEGWKTYWRAPGDAGIPPILDWSLSGNLASTHMTWPTPVVFDQSGMRSIGYKNAVILPIALEPRRDGRPVKLRGTLDIGVCKDICVPQRLKVRATLPADADQRDPRIAAALAARPLSASEAELRAIRCTISPTANGLRIGLEIDMPSAGAPEAAVVESGLPDVWVAAPKTRRAGGTLFAETEMQHVSGGVFMLDRSALRVTVIGRKHAVDIRGCDGT